MPGSGEKLNKLANTYVTPPSSVKNLLWAVSVHPYPPPRDEGQGRMCPRGPPHAAAERARTLTSLALSLRLVHAPRNPEAK